MSDRETQIYWVGVIVGMIAGYAAFKLFGTREIIVHHVLSTE